MIRETFLRSFIYTYNLYFLLKGKWMSFPLTSLCQLTELSFSDTLLRVSTVYDGALHRLRPETRNPIGHSSFPALTGGIFPPLYVVFWQTIQDPHHVFQLDCNHSLQQHPSTLSLQLSSFFSAPSVSQSVHSS